MNEEIVCKAGVTFLKINVFGESQHLNPFSINTDQIRYIRKYTDAKEDAWAVIVGEKMYPTRELNFDHVKIGDVIKIGNTEFECATTTSLTEKDKYKTLINYKNVLYIRKYLKKDNKNDSKNSENLDKFAIITVDERIIPVINENEVDNGIGSTEASAPVSAENM
jgi:hypothetical protein